MGKSIVKRDGLSVLLTVVFASYFVAIAGDLFSIFKGNKKGSRV